MLRTLIVILFVVVLFGCAEPPPAVRYIDTIELVQKFELNMDLSRQLEADLVSKKKIIDSQIVVIKMTNPTKAEKVKKEMLRELDYVNQQSQSEINEAIWNRLNPILQEFGKAKHYDILFGANGLGSIIYGDPTYDVTSEAIDYVNKKYQGE